ncbi:hypothetical protein B0T10DRAFT_467999 [Thelonectria olida]|uniref:Protein kinase domain-containing protein n=1 Tax=Thelonectria olida TaxID=1576542 RepID=A0A9P8VNT2_9HYPO|nr:hypothetical protein B0T10DRAFT_467999 [Thelonectria olida]
MDHKAATTIELRRRNMTNFSENMSPFPDKTLQQTDDGNEVCRCPILISCFPGFTEPRLKNGMLAMRPVHDYEPAGVSATLHSGMLQKRELVLTEWRSTHTELENSTISAEELARCCDHIASLLRGTAVSNDDYRILNCLGFCLVTGRLLNGCETSIVCFVYRLPTNVAGNSPLSTQRKIIGDSFTAPDPCIPDLDDRCHLAYSLAISLYHLHCAGWIHRKMSSYNIFFFRDKASGEIELTRPYLKG